MALKKQRACLTIEAKFLDAMRATGLFPVNAEIKADGHLHRYRVEGDKAGSLNGWYVLFFSPIPAGAFGSWRTGETHTWRDDAARADTPAERAEWRKQIQSLKALRADAEHQIRAASQLKAQTLWKLGWPASANHPYLARKRVKAWGVRQLRDALLIPAYDVWGQLHTLQFIQPDGRKRFLTGGRISACYHAIGRPCGTVCICEGYATAASVFEATGHATAVAFNAGNLSPVARALRAKFPDGVIIICADHDTATPGNPGLTKAIEAARAVHGLVAKPDFSGAVV